MKLHSRLSIPLLAAVFLSGAANSQSTQAQPVVADLLRPVTTSADPMLGKLPTLMKGRRVSVNLELLERARPGQLVRIEFFKDTVYHARLVEREAAPSLKNGYHWHGTLQGKTGSQFTITVGSGGIASWFSTMDDEMDVLTFEGNPTEAYARRYASDMKQGSGVQVPSWLRKQFQQNTELSFGAALAGCSDSPDVINVAAYYTGLANVQSTLSAAARIANGITQGNTVMKNGGSKMRFYLRKLAIINAGTVEFRSMRAILDALSHKTDKVMDVVHTDRVAKSIQADLVTLIVADLSQHGTTAGIGWRPGTTAQLTPAVGFSVCEWSSLANYTLVHEFGHNFGCSHDSKHHNPKEKRIYSYSFGYNKNYWNNGFPFYVKHYFYTVMSYKPSTSCSFPWVCKTRRVPVFSSPSVRLSFGKDTGGIHSAGISSTNNYQTIANTRQKVANYSRVLTGSHVLNTLSIGPAPAISNIQIGVSLKDSQGRFGGRTPMTRTYCGGSVVLTAPTFYGGRKLGFWRLNGKAQAAGKTTLLVSMNRSHVAVPEYHTYHRGTTYTFGSGCVGTAKKTPNFYMNGQTPDIGNKVAFNLINARPSSNGLMNVGGSRTSWGASKLPLDMGIIGVNGCKLLVSIDLQFAIRTDSRGNLYLPTTVQNVPALIGRPIYWQVAVFDVGAPRPTKVTMSNGVVLVIGGLK